MTTRISPFTKAHVEAAFELVTDVFVSSSTLHHALNIKLNEYRTYLRPSFEAMISEGLSVVALDETTNEIIGCVIATDFHLHLSESATTNTKLAPLLALTHELCTQYKQKCSTVLGETILVDMAAVDPNHLGKGLYRQMRETAHQIAKLAGYRNVVGELSSASTQHVVLNRFGHKAVAEIQFSEFEFDGRKPFASITEPTSIILAGGST